MEIIDPGHHYRLDTLDSTYVQRLVFVKRMGEKYPGNTDAYGGTTIQEVCRALIDRLQYVNKQIWCSEDDISIRYLRGVILELETRAATRHGRRIFPRHDIENEPTCRHCGHIQCNEGCRSKGEERADASMAENQGTGNSQG